MVRFEKRHDVGAQRFVSIARTRDECGSCVRRTLLCVGKHLVEGWPAVRGHVVVLPISER
jgi:hypothetical protein